MDTSLHVLQHIMQTKHRTTEINIENYRPQLSISKWVCWVQQPKYDSSVLVQLLKLLCEGLNCELCVMSQFTFKYCPCPAETKDGPTTGHKLHHNVSTAGVWPDKCQAADSGPDTESWVDERVHSVARQISGVPPNAAKTENKFHCVRRSSILKYL